MIYDLAQPRYSHAPFHYLPHPPCIHELPLSHFYGPCVVLHLRYLEPSPPIDAAAVALQRSAA